MRCVRDRVVDCVSVADAFKRATTGCLWSTEANQDDLTAILGMSMDEMRDFFKGGASLTDMIEKSAMPGGDRVAQLRPLTTFLDEDNACDLQMFADGMVVGLESAVQCLGERSEAVSGKRIPAGAISFRPGATVNFIVRYSKPKRLYRVLGDQVLLGVVLTGERIRARRSAERSAERLARQAALACGIVTDATTLDWDGKLPGSASQHIVVRVGASDHTLRMEHPEDMFRARAVLASRFEDEGASSISNIAELYDIAMVQFIWHMTYKDVDIRPYDVRWDLPDVGLHHVTAYGLLTTSKENFRKYMTA